MTCIAHLLMKFRPLHSTTDQLLIAAVKNSLPKNRNGHGLSENIGLPLQPIITRCDT